MGGSTARGNTRPYAEFNALVDPEAAEIVFASGKPLTMVGLNLTHQAQATPEVIEPPARRRQRGRRGDGRLAVLLRRHLSHGLRLRRARRCTTRARWRCSSTRRSCAASRPSSPSRPRGAGRAGRRSSTCTAAWAGAQRARGHGARRDALLGPRHRRDRRAVIVVVGSINLDLVVGSSATRRRARPCVGGDRRELPGGKGANQAVAAARLGADVGHGRPRRRRRAGGRLREGLADRGRRRRARVARSDRPLRASR